MCNAITTVDHGVSWCIMDGCKMVFTIKCTVVYYGVTTTVHHFDSTCILKKNQNAPRPPELYMTVHHIIGVNHSSCRKGREGKRREEKGRGDTMWGQAN